MILFCLIKVSKINCFKEDKTTFKQARVILTPIKRKNGFKFKINWTCAFRWRFKGIAHAGAIKF
jgi:hypothetical protein